jgi:hypothetical protein
VVYSSRARRLRRRRWRHAGDGDVAVGRFGAPEFGIVDGGLGGDFLFRAGFQLHCGGRDGGDSCAGLFAGGIEGVDLRADHDGLRTIRGILDPRFQVDLGRGGGDLGRGYRGGYGREGIDEGDKEGRGGVEGGGGVGEGSEVRGGCGEGM